MKRLGLAIFLVALTAVSLIPRLAGLRSWTLSGDDALHALYASTPFGEMLPWALRYDAHPPGAWMLLRLLILLGAGSTPLGLRLIALIPGSLLIFAFYGLGRTATKSSSGGLTLAFVGAFSNTIVVTSQEVRNYTLMLLFLSLMLTAFLLPTRRAQAAYLVCAALGVCVHYAVAFVVAVTGSIGLVSRWRTHSARAIALMPWGVAHFGLALFWYRMVARSDWIGPTLPGFMQWTTVASADKAWSALLRTFSAMHLSPHGPFSWILLIPAIWGIISLIRRRDVTLLSLSVAPFAVALALAIAQRYPLVGVNRWALWLVPTSLIPVGVGVVDVMTRFGRKSGLACATAVLLGALANQALAYDGIFRPDALRVTVNPQWIRTVDDELAAAAMIAQTVPDGATILVNWTDGLRDGLASLQHWPRRFLRAEHLVCPLPSWEKTDIRGCLRELPTVHGTAWILALLDRPPTRELEKMVADPCLAVLNARRTARDALLQIDVDKSRALLETPGCH
jgi:hypothetical protein